VSLGLFPQGKSGKGVKLTIHLHTMRTLWTREPYLHCP
jgi:hypothetical protein